MTTTGQTQGNESFFLAQRKTETEQRWRLAARFGDGKLRQFLCVSAFSFSRKYEARSSVESLGDRSEQGRAEGEKKKRVGELPLWKW